MEHNHAGHNMGHNGNHTMHDMAHMHEMHEMHNMPASDHEPVFNTSIMETMNTILNETNEDMMTTMDHSMHGLRGSEHDHAMPHSEHGGMSMTFHGGYLETILFSWWDVKGVGEFIGSFFAIFIVALLYEGLKYYRKHLLWKTYSGLQYCAVAPPDKGVANVCATDEAHVIQPLSHLPRNAPTMLSSPHVWQTFLHGVQVLVSYMLMLVFMSYNTWLCLAVVLGSAFGYFLFGWRESVVVDFTEHCH